MLRSIFFIAALVSVCIADCYMHNPRGSNNRLNEQSANRANGNRVFDSQNNNRGGYNVGDMHDTQGFRDGTGYGTDEKMYNYANTDWQSNNNDGRVQFEPSFLEGSTQRVTHTVQHGCDNPKNNCNIVYEYTCDTIAQDVNVFNTASDYDYDGQRVQLKNGLNTGTSQDPNNIAQVDNTYRTNSNNDRGIHESEEYYAYAKARDRNQGLFTADQKLQGNSQIYTRQNPGGTRRGLEVPEERDYFPWWNPSIWRPLLIWHNNVTECEIEMAQKSQAVETKYQCIPTKAQFKAENANDLATIVSQTTEAGCVAENAVWKAHKYDMAAPLCVQAGWSQVNNLGNVENTEDGGLPRYYDLTLPTIDQLEAAGCHIYTMETDDAALNKKKARLVFRTRYNMTTTDYAPYNTDANCNQDNGNEVQSPVQQNPTVDVGMKMQGLRLAINTAQTGRTFQDRSHVTAIVERSNMAGVDANKKILNVNVQGKRGNIVQTFPAVEYDFWPRKAEIKEGECLAFMWTGSNTHNNGNPAGDGQAGDAGEGRGGSDRSNLIQLNDKRESYPIPLDKNTNDFFAQSNCYQTIGGAAWGSGEVGGAVNEKDAQLFLLSGGYYNTFADVAARDDNLDPLLDNVSATMRSMTCCPQTTGQFYFVSTRNNNFSNRDQKLEIVVSPA